MKNLMFQTTLCIVYKDGEYPQDPYVPTIFENYAGEKIKKMNLYNSRIFGYSSNSNIE